MMIQHASQPVILLSHSLAQEEGMFGSDFDAASLLDLTLFLACVKRFRRERKMHVMKARIHTLWKDLRDSIISLLSASLQKSVRDLIQSVGPDISNRSIPSRKKRKRESQSWRLIALCLGMVQMMMCNPQPLAGQESTSL